MLVRGARPRWRFLKTSPIHGRWYGGSRLPPPVLISFTDATTGARAKFRCVLTIRGVSVSSISPVRSTRRWRKRDANGWSPCERLRTRREFAADSLLQRRVKNKPVLVRASGSRLRTCTRLCLSSNRFWFVASSLFGAGRPFFASSPAIKFAEAVVLQGSRW